MSSPPKLSPPKVKPQNWSTPPSSPVKTHTGLAPLPQPQNLHLHDDFQRWRMDAELYISLMPTAEKTYRLMAILGPDVRDVLAGFVDPYVATTEEIFRGLELATRPLENEGELLRMLWTRTQQPGERPSHFLAALRRLAARAYPPRGQGADLLTTASNPCCFVVKCASAHPSTSRKPSVWPKISGEMTPTPTCSQ